MNKSKQTIFIIVMAAVIAIGLYFYTSNNFSETDQRNIRLEELLALTALTFLYASVLPNPLKRIFPDSPAIETYKQIQPAIVAATLGIAVIHATIAFFFLLGGFAGLGFLSPKFLLGIILSTTAILTLLLVFIFNFFQRKFSWLNNLLYIVGLLISIHALLLGADFIILSGTIPKIFFAALLILLAIESWSLDVWITRTRPTFKKFGIAFAICLIILSGLAMYLFSPQTKLPSLSEHANHIGMDMTGMNMGSMPGMVMTGDPSKKYTVSFSTIPANPQPNQDVVLKFQVYDAANGNPITNYDIVMTKILHLVIVDNSLAFFNHIHPELNGSVLSVTTKFPKSDLYRLYLNFQPSGGQEQQVALTLPVGTGVGSAPDNTLTESTRAFGDITATIGTSDGQPLDSAKMNGSTQNIKFNLKNSTSDEPITDLMPYLGAFGHLVLINTQTYQYIHIHPLPSLDTDFSGPDVEFVPASFFGAITPGTYRVFGQFNRANNIFVTDFTINIK